MEFLIDTFTFSSTIDRDGRAIQRPYKYIPTSNMYINRRVDNLMPLGPSALKQNFQFQGASTGGPSAPNHQFFNNRVPPNAPSNGPTFNGPSSGPSSGPSNGQFNGQEVSETDLYLLSAIEKLVYRVDYMERRLRKTEQLVYYLMAGNNENKKEIYGKHISISIKLIILKLCKNILKLVCVSISNIFRKTVLDEFHANR